MAELATIARPYAEALFRVAQKEGAGSLNAWSVLVDEMSQAAQHPDVIAMIQNPKMSVSLLADTFVSLLKSPVNQEAKNFVETLATYHRLLTLPEIAAQYHALKNTLEGAADADISSAFAMTDDQTKTLCNTLEAKFGRKLNPTVKVDTSLIGGIRVVVGDEVLDTSVRAKLQQMQVALTA